MRLNLNRSPGGGEKIRSVAAALINTLLAPQAGEGSHRGGHQYAGRHSLGERAVRRHRPAQVAVRRLVARRVPGQQDGVRRRTWVRSFIACCFSLSWFP